MATGNFGQNRTPYQTNYDRNAPPPILQIKPEPIPADYVSVAETVINQWNSKNFTSTKLRKIFGLFVDTYNEIKRSNDNEALSNRQIRDLEAARVRMIYECGRDNDVKLFVSQAKLLQYLKSVGSSTEQFIAFYHYMEALVAYHRYRFGNK